MTVSGGGDEGDRLQLATVGGPVKIERDGEASLRTYALPPLGVKGF